MALLHALQTGGGHSAAARRLDRAAAVGARALEAMRLREVMFVGELQRELATARLRSVLRRRADGALGRALAQWWRGAA